MAKFRTSGHLLTLGGYRLSQDLGSLSLPIEREDLDISGFEDVVNQHGAGSLNQAGTLSGIASDTLDSAVVEALRTAAAAVPLVFAQNAAAALTARAWIGEARLGSDERDRQRQQYEQATVGLWLDRAVLLGSVLHNWLQDGAVTTTENGAAVALGALGAGEEMFLAVAMADPPQATGTGTCTITIESSALGDFTDAVVRATFAVLAAGDLRGAELIVIDGDADPVTDTTWRAVLTVVETAAPSFPLLIAAGIAAKAA